MKEQTHVAVPGAQRKEKLPEYLSPLMYWLANEDIYTSDYVRKWLKRTPHEEAADILARIAENAQPEPHSLWYMLFRALAMIFTTSETISEKGPAGRKAGTRAALLLAHMNDARSLAPLVRVFETDWFWAGKYQEDIEAALLRFLSGAAGNPEIRRYAEPIRTLVERIWRTGHGRRELSPRLTDLLLAALPILRDVGEEPDLTLLKSIAASHAKAPNRTRVKEAAVALLSASG